MAELGVFLVFKPKSSFTNKEVETQRGYKVGPRPKASLLRRGRAEIQIWASPPSLSLALICLTTSSWKFMCGFNVNTLIVVLSITINAQKAIYFPALVQWPQL